MDINHGYLRELETPKYYALKHKNDKVSRIYHTENEESFYSGEDFYQDMVKHSSNDSVYDLLHQLSPSELEEAVQSSCFIINKDNVPNNQTNNSITNAFNGTAIPLDNYFNEKGLVVANVERLTQIPDQISNFIKVIDSQGNTFIKVLLKNI